MYLILLWHLNKLKYNQKVDLTQKLISKNEKKIFVTEMLVY